MADLAEMAAGLSVLIPDLAHHNLARRHSELRGRVNLALDPFVFFGEPIIQIHGRELVSCRVSLSPPKHSFQHDARAECLLAPSLVLSFPTRFGRPDREHRPESDRITARFRDQRAAFWCRLVPSLGHGLPRGLVRPRRSGSNTPA